MWQISFAHNKKVKGVIVILRNGIKSTKCYLEWPIKMIIDKLNDVGYMVNMQFKDNGPVYYVFNVSLLASSDDVIFICKCQFVESVVGRYIGYIV